MPTPGYGTTNNLGHVSLWIISLGSQKNSVLQLLGKDELCKHKTILSAVKYVKSKLLEAQTQSDGRQDLDSKLTPIKMSDTLKENPISGNKSIRLLVHHIKHQIIIDRIKIVSNQLSTSLTY